MGGRGRPHVSLVLPPSSTIPLVDRETERKALSQILLEAQQGKGSTWLIDGPGGIGKTRLAQWVREEAERRGFRTRSGHCLKEVNNAFFPWLQIFRGSASLPANRLLSGTKFPPGVHIFEEERPERIWVRLLETSIVVPDAMVISREKAGVVRQRLPSLPSTVRMLSFSRVEGTDLISPVQLDVLGETLSSWLREHPGGMVGLVGLEYLVTQNTFLPVLRLVQFLREIADETGGRILLSFRPDTLEDRERSLLEAEGEVERVSRPPREFPTESEPPARVFLRYLEIVEEEAKEIPLLILLDDLQWADPLSLQAFRFIARNIRNIPVLLLGTRRTNEEGHSIHSVEYSLQDMLEEVAAEGTVAHLHLGSLDKVATMAVMNSLLPAPLESESAVHGLQDFLQRAGGNPYLILETTRMLAEEGLLKVDNDAIHLVAPAGQDLPVLFPDNVVRAERRRLAITSPDERELLEVGAMQGCEFELSVVAAVLGRPVTSLKRLTQRLEGPLHFLTHESDGQDQARDMVAFSHPLLWEVVKAEMSPERRSHFALALARWWESHRPAEVDTVARLYHEGGDPTGVHWVDKALTKSADRGDDGMVVRYGNWRMELQQIGGVGVDEQARGGLEVMEMLRRLGAFQAAVRWGEQLDRWIPPGELWWEVRLCWVDCIAVQEVSRARALLDEILEKFPRLPKELAERLQFRLYGAKVSVLSREGRVEATLEAEQARLAIARQMRDRNKVISALYGVGYGLVALGKSSQARPLIQEGMALAVEEGSSPQDRAMIRGAYAFLLESDGDLKGAAEEYETCATTFLDTGHVSNAVINLNNLGYLLLELAEWKRSAIVLEKARTLARKVGYEQGIVASDHYRAVGFALQGKWPEALSLMNETLVRYRELGYGEEVGTLLGWMAEGYARCGDLGRAWATLAESEEIVSHGRTEERVTVLRVKGTVAFLDRRDEEARKWLREAVSLAERGVAAWGERLRALNALFELEDRSGNHEAADEVWAELNVVRQRIGLTPVKHENLATDGS